MRGDEPTVMESMAGGCRNVRPRAGSVGRSRLPRQVATYLFLLAFLAPPSFTATPTPAALCNPTLGGRQRSKVRPHVPARMQLSLVADWLRNPKPGLTAATGPNRSQFPPPVSPPTFSQNPSTQICQFRPLRC